MNREELRENLQALGINKSLFSLNGDLLPDRVVLYHSYNNWLVFYFDERGNRNDERVFTSEDEACRYIFERFKN